LLVVVGTLVQSGERTEQTLPTLSTIETVSPGAIVAPAAGDWLITPNCAIVALHCELELIDTELVVSE
jgi:hypothetical protein